MTYDSIDTNENDSSADRKITIDEINGADTSAASNGELLGSDGSGNLQFISAPSSATVLSSGTGVTVDRNRINRVSSYSDTVFTGSARTVYGGHIATSKTGEFTLTFSDGTTFTNSQTADVQSDGNSNHVSYNHIPIPVANNVTQLDVEYDSDDESNAASGHVVYYE